MDLESITKKFNLESEFVALGLLAFALVMVLVVNRQRIRSWFLEWRIQRCLDRIGSEQIRDLVCADGLEGYYKIDRLALTRDAILLISYKPFGGNIYCAERISEWTQVIGQKSFKFENPLFELENQITALRLLIGDTPLYGYLFFDNSALFPKGHPDKVLNPETIPAEFIAEHCENPNAKIKAAWDLLKAHQTDAPDTGGVGAKT
jgi:hypothetical protein